MRQEEQQELINLFFTSIAPEAATGKIKVEDFNYNIGFNTILYKTDYTNSSFKDKLYNERKTIEKHISLGNEDLPTIEINNLNEFGMALLNYFDEVNKKNILWTTPPEDISGVNHKKYYLSVVWGNMGIEDFKNPINYLNKYINFIKDRTFDEYMGKTELGLLSNLDNAKLEIKNNPQKGNFETPYNLEVCISKKYDEEIDLKFYLPDVRYAIDTDINGNKVGYIYAVQKTKKQSDYKYDPKYSESNQKYQKQMNRLIYKIGKGVLGQETDEYKEYRQNDDKDYYPENITDVSQSALISLSVILSLMEKQNINVIKVADYLPIRYTSKEEYYNSKIKFMKGMGAEEIEIADYEVEAYLEHLAIQRNLTDKFVRNFRRLDYHFDNINIPVLPGETDEFMQINIKKPENDNFCNNEILKEIYNVTKSYKKETGKGL